MRTILNDRRGGSLIPRVSRTTASTIGTRGCDIVVLVVCLSIAAVAHAQQTVQATTDANLRLEPSTTARVVIKAPAGALLEVAEVTGDWYRVRLPRDTSGFERTAYIHKSVARTLVANSAQADPKPSAIVNSPSPAESVPSPSLPPPESAPASPPPRGTGKPVAAVLDFEYGAVRQEWSGYRWSKEQQPLISTWDIGKGIADLLVDTLLQSGSIRLVERRRLDDILKEQEFANGDRASLSAKDAARLGGSLGAQYLIVGSVTKFGGEQKNLGGAAAAITSKIFLGGFGIKKTLANVGLSVRLVDSTTGEILASVRGEGQSKRKGVLLGGLAGGAGGIGGGGIDMGSSGFQETILGEATLLAVNDAGAKLLVAIKQVTSTQVAARLADPRPGTQKPFRFPPAESN